MVYILLANGFEEIEALTPWDLIKRAGYEVKLVTINKTEKVSGTHGIIVSADTVFSKCSFDDLECLILPGGMPGASNLFEDERVKKLVIKTNEEKKPLCAICAAPFILGKLGILNNKKATCFPGFEDKLEGAEVTGEKVTTSENIVTGKGMGASFDFGLAIIDLLSGNKTLSEKIRKATMA